MRVLSVKRLYVENFAPTFGHNYGGRLMVAWLDR